MSAHISIPSPVPGQGPATLRGLVVRPLKIAVTLERTIAHVITRRNGSAGGLSRGRKNGPNSEFPQPHFSITRRLAATDGRARR